MNKRTICTLIDEIYALAHVLNLLFEQVENADINVNPHAVAAIADRIAVDIIRISQCFHDNHHPP